MPEMGAFLLATQAMAAPGELLNLSLNATAVLPEGAVLLAMIATLLDLAGEKVASTLGSANLLLGPGRSAGPARPPVERPAGTFLSRGVPGGQPGDGVPCRHRPVDTFVAADQLALRRAERNAGGEYAAILLAATLGAMLLCGATDLVSVFISLRPFPWRAICCRAT